MLAWEGITRWSEGVPGLQDMPAQVPRLRREENRPDLGADDYRSLRDEPLDDHYHLLTDLLLVPFGMDRQMAGMFRVQAGISAGYLNWDNFNPPNATK